MTVELPVAKSVEDTIARFEALAEALLRVKERVGEKLKDAFWMSVWQSRHKWQFAQCGFAGCAIGWGIFEGVLPGLKLVDPKFDPEYDLAPSGYPVIDGAEHSGENVFEELAVYFGITKMQADRLFLPGYYREAGNSYGEEALDEVVRRLRYAVSQMREYGDPRQLDMRFDPPYDPDAEE